MTFYTVKDHEFPGNLRGLTEAIKVGREYAQTEPVDVFKVSDGNVTVAYSIDYMPKPSKPGREGNYPQEGGAAK